MRKFWVILMVLGATSCDFFISKDRKTEELVNKELQEIDWNEVDNYPLFENCDETLTKTGQRTCFETEFIKHCSKTLRVFEFVIDSDINPAVRVDFLVDEKGKITVIDIRKDSAIDAQMPEFDGIIAQSLKALPPLAPALKRGIPVKVKFRIPIILNRKK